MKKVYLFIFSSLMFLSVFCFTQATLAVCTQSITVNTAFDYYGTPACNPGTTTPGTISVAMSSAQVTSLLNNNKTLSLYNNIPNTAYTVNGKCFDYMTSISLETCVPRDPLNGSCSITAKSGTCAVPTCNNGYINYPTCNTCPVGKGMYNNSCVTCPAGTILSGSVCVDNCTQSSGATLDISKIKKYTLTNFPGNVSDIMLISHTTDYNSLFSVPFPSSPNPYVGPYNIPILINYSLKTYTGDNGMSYGFTLPSFDFPTVVSGYDINSGAFQYSVSLGGGLYSAPYIGSGNGDYHANEYYSGCLSLVASACPTKTSLSGLSCVGSPTLTLSNNKCGTILLTWTDVSPGVYYNIYKSDKSTFIASTTGMTYELSNLTAGTYDYVIEAVGKYGDRFWSDPKTIPIVNCFLNVATSTFCGLTGGSVGLSWNSILNTKYYTIYDYTGTTILATTTGLTYSKTGFPQDTFGYYVEALGNDGSKIKSGPVNVTVKGCVNISSSVIQDTPSLCKNTVNLSWTTNNIPNIKYFNIYSPDTTTLLATTTNYNYANLNVPVSSIYYYVIPVNLQDQEVVSAKGVLVVSFGESTACSDSKKIPVVSGASTACGKANLNWGYSAPWVSLCGVGNPGANYKDYIYLNSTSTTPLQTYSYPSACTCPGSGSCTLGSGTFTYSATNLSPGTNKFIVKRFDGSKNYYSSPALIDVAACPISGLTATSTSCGVVDLSWNVNVANPNYYNIYYGSGILATTTSTRYRHIGVSGNPYYAVSVVDSNNVESEKYIASTTIYSDSYCTNSKPAPTAVSNVCQSVNITWPKVTTYNTTIPVGYYAYKVYDNTGVNFLALVPVGSFTTTSFAAPTIYNLPAGNLGFYVSLFSASTRREYFSNMVVTNISSCKPNVTVSQPSCGNVRLDWNKVNGAQSYTVYSRIGTNPYTAQTTITSTSTIFTGLAGGSRDYYVETLDTNNIRTSSDVVSVSVCESAKTTVLATSTNCNVVDLSWSSNVPNVSSSKVYYPNISTLLLDTPSSTLRHFGVTGLANYKVSSFISSGVQVSYGTTSITAFSLAGCSYYKPDVKPSLTCGSATLSWTDQAAFAPSPNARYKIYDYTGVNVLETIVPSVQNVGGTDSYTLSDLPEGELGFYVSYARCKDTFCTAYSYESFSDKIVVNISACPPLPGVPEVTGTSPDQGTVLLEWPEALYAESYNIYNSNYYDIDGNVDKINSFIASTTSLSYYEGAQKEPGDYAYYVSAVNVTGESEVGPVLVNIGDYCKNGATNFPACDECGVNLSGVQESWVKDLYTGEFSCGICDSETEQVDLGSGICKIIGQPDLNWESTGCGTKFTWAPVEGAVAYRLYGYNYNGYDTGTDYDLAVEEIPSSAEKKDGLYLAITYFPQGTVPEGELMYSLVAVDADGNESAPAIVNDVVVVCACGYTDEAMCDGGHLDKSGCCVFCDVPGEIWSGEIPTLLDLPPVAGQTLPKCVVHPCNEDNLKNLTAEQKLRCVIPDPTDEECISICGQNPDDPICVNCPQPLDYYCFGNKPKGDYVKFGLNTKNGTNMQPSWEYSTSTLLGGCQWTCGKGPGGSGSVRRGNGCVLDLSRTQ